MVGTVNTERASRALEFGLYRDGDNNLDEAQALTIAQALETSGNDGSIEFTVEDTTARRGSSRRTCCGRSPTLSPTARFRTRLRSGRRTTWRHARTSRSSSPVCSTTRRNRKRGRRGSTSSTTAARTTPIFPAPPRGLRRLPFERQRPKEMGRVSPAIDCQNEGSLRATRRGSACRCPGCA